MDSRTYQTKSIEQAAAIMAVSKIDPRISFNESGLATFSFPQLPAVIEVVMQYETGFMVDARTVLNTRNQLFKRVRGGRI
jgi:hypothetical protein